MTQPENILEMKDISKSFPGVKALDGADLSVLPGEVHGLVGENGAGKSTIIKVLAGVYGKDTGDVVIEGKSLGDITPQKAHEAGVRFIHQELHLVPYFTVAESVFMGQEVETWFGVDRKRMRLEAERFLAESLHAKIDGKLLIRDLGVAERKLVQIARALVDNKARIVVFDEPTAPLASGEIAQLFSAIARLKERGISMIYVSHYLGEITDICDRVTVFRNGTDVGVLDQLAPDNTDKIINLMVGRDIADFYPQKMHTVGAPMLEIRKLGDGSHFRDLDLTIGRGEIVGITGLIGSGREEFIDTLYGLAASQSGEILLDGKPVKVTTPTHAVENGIVLVPRDRRQDGLVLGMTMADNINLASLEEIATGIIENRSAAVARADKLAEDLDIRPRNVNTITQLLSGGNQQKVVLARWLATGAKLLILDEPTVGVDVGAKVEIYRLIEDLATNEAAVLISSSDPSELLGVCDRIVVLLRGDIVASVSARETSIDELVALTTGGVVGGGAVA